MKLPKEYIPHAILAAELILAVVVATLFALR